MAIEKVDTSESLHICSECTTLNDIQSVTSEWYKSTLVPLAGYVQYLCDIRMYRTVLLSPSPTGGVCCIEAKDHIRSKNEALGFLFTSILKNEELSVNPSEDVT